MADEMPNTEAPKPDALKPASNDPGLVVTDTGEFSNMLDTAKFNHMWRVSQTFCRSQLVPEQYRGKPENCMIACWMAVRLSVDPFMFMQNTYVVHGRPGMEAKLAIALVNSRGPFTGPIQWRFTGEGKSRACTAYATHRGTGEVCEATVTWAMVEGEGWDKNPKWKTMPEMMFRYRSATFLARLYAPECLMGMSTLDELHDIKEVAADFREIPAANSGAVISMSDEPHVDLAQSITTPEPKRRGRPPKDVPDAEVIPEPQPEPEPEY